MLPLIYRQFCHEGSAGPLPVLWQWNKDFPAPKARQRMPGTCFSAEHTNNTCFLVDACIIWTLKKKHLHLIKEIENQKPNSTSFWSHFSQTADFQESSNFCWDLGSLFACPPCFTRRCSAVPLGFPSWAAWEEPLPVTEQLHHLKNHEKPSSLPVEMVSAKPFYRKLLVFQQTL